MRSKSKTVTSKEVTLILNEFEAKLLLDLVGEVSFTTFINMGFDKDASDNLTSMTEDMYNALSSALYNDKEYK